MGHGAFLRHGDKDIGILSGGFPNTLHTNHRYYALPSSLQEVRGFARARRAADRDDGELDGKWLGHDLSERRILHQSPATTIYQSRQVRVLLRRKHFGRDRVPDLFFTNYKQIDEVGHTFNMLNPAMKHTLSHADEGLRSLVSFLNRRVGANRWVLAVTADHGQSPRPESVGAWGIRAPAMKRDIARHFHTGGLIQRTHPAGLWLNRRVMSNAGITLSRISNFLSRYQLRHNARRPIPRPYRDRADERLFAAVFPSHAMASVWRCALKRWTISVKLVERTYRWVVNVLADAWHVGGISSELDKS
jgi:hypothetical protein